MTGLGGSPVTGGGEVTVHVTTTTISARDDDDDGVCSAVLSHLKCDDDDVTPTTTSASASNNPAMEVEVEEETLPIYYFGYGPIVHPLVRERRGIQRSHVQAAMLLEHRLTFAYGGVVNMVPQRGFQVHGLLIQFDSTKDWARFQEFDAGYDLDEVQVYPYTDDGMPPDLENDEDDDNSSSNSNNCNNNGLPITAYAFVMKDFDGNKLDKVTASTIEKLPQERYLKLISSGMRAHNIDDDYIEDQILSIPYSPKAKPEDFRTFPLRPSSLSSFTGPVSASTSSATASGGPNSSSSRRRGSLTRLRGGRNHQQSSSSVDAGPRGTVPTITFHDYETRLCRNAGPHQVYFVIGMKVIQIDPPFQPHNPCVVWFRQRAHGGPDLTLTLHKTVIDPDIPLVYTLEDLTPLHFAWAENHCIEYLEQGGIRGTQIYELVGNGGSVGDPTDVGTDPGPLNVTRSVDTTRTQQQQQGHQRHSQQQRRVSGRLRRCLERFLLSSTTDTSRSNNNNNVPIGPVNRSNNSGRSLGNRIRRAMNSSNSSDTSNNSNMNNNSHQQSHNNSNNNNNSNSIGTRPSVVATYFSSSELMNRNFPLEGGADDDEDGGTIHLDDDIDDDDHSSLLEDDGQS